MKLYVAIQRFLNKNWVHYIVLFFILISIVAVIASSFEEMSRYRLALFGITYISSFVFLLEYAARILSAPALHPTKSAIKARLLYTFSFLTSSTCHPKFISKQWRNALMAFHQHSLIDNLLALRQCNLYSHYSFSKFEHLVHTHIYVG